MKQVDSGRAPMTWNDRMRQQSGSCPPPVPSGD
jgi:hypothetical protein